ncbi:MAG: hypothetical protein HQL94_09815 [Magnetococcales bacterium]|nr:hypothetical protein [Magnetococcales bacterium]
MNVNNANSESNWTDPDDAPEFTNTLFDKADWYEGDRLIRSGPLSTNPGLDLDVFVALQSRGGDWRTQMNNALREWLSIVQPKPNAF